MVRLNRSMMERYEIPERRPRTLRAVLFGADRLMLGAAARLLDQANALGRDLGALCVTPAAAALREQDCMYTLLIRGERDDGAPDREERVVQSVLRALDPEADFDALLACASEPELDLAFLSGGSGAMETALLARFLYARWEAGCAMPCVLLLDEHPQAGSADALRAAIAALARDWARGGDFVAALALARLQCVLVEGLCGPLNDSERALAQQAMNYRDDFIAWAEPQLCCTPEAQIPEALAGVCATGGFALACERKDRVFGAAVFLCAALGYLCGMDSFHQVFADDGLRAWIGRAFFDEVLPELPWPREEVSPYIISTFGRLENSMNDMPLLEIGQGLMRDFSRTLLPAIRAHAEREFEAPKRLSLALSAAIMLYAGARRGASGAYEVLRGEQSAILRDDPEILEAFSRLAHDMPAETLAYAALADRAIWGADLREIDGLELRVSCNLSSIQRVGLREAMRIQEEV